MKFLFVVVQELFYDSVPENEYQECLNKAGAVVEAIKMADGGIDYDSTH